MHKRFSKSKLAGVTVATIGIVGLLAGCSGTPASTGVPQDPKSTIVVWTDATRQPGFEQYQKDHPDVKMDIETYDETGLLAKIQLFNQTGKGWPDVIFSGTPSQIASLALPSFGYAADLTNLIPKDVFDGFGAANDQCIFDGKPVCLKNDLAQSVLWYNKTLMDQFGYKVPTTWAEYEALGADVAKNHPGYVLGAGGSTWAYQNFFVPAGCPLQDTSSLTDVKINALDPSCAKVATMLDNMLANGSLARFNEFDPEFVALGQAQKILMLPGPSWLGDFVFKPEASYNTPAGSLAAASYPKWDGADQPYTGFIGGGIFMVSSHSANLQGSADIINYMTTNNDVQVKSPAFPAYGPANKAWAERLKTDPFYAEDPYPAMAQMSTLVNPITHLTRYIVETSFGNTVTEAARSGGNYTDNMEALQSDLLNAATTAGYTVAK